MLGGDLKVEDNDIYMGEIGVAGTVRIKSGYSELQITDEAGTSYKSIRLGGFYADQMVNRATAFSLKTVGNFSS